jgi:hypothetical protein
MVGLGKAFTDGSINFLHDPVQYAVDESVGLLGREFTAELHRLVDGDHGWYILTV